MPRAVLALVRPVGNLRIDYLPGTGLALLKLIVTLKRYGLGQHAAALLAGGGSRTADANRALEHLAAHLDDPGFDRLFREFLGEYGHRETASPILVTPPTWEEDPETVLALVRMLAAPRPGCPRGPAPAPAHPSPPQRAKAPRAGGTPGQGGQSGRRLPRGQPLLLHDAPAHPAQGVAGDRRQARLRPPEDVFHLRLEEIEAIDDPAAMPYMDRVLARKARREELRGVRLIDPRVLFPATDSGDALVGGTPASGGRASGPVRVIREPAEFGTLRAGDVLVCPYTNPSWTPLFQRAAAVVVDTGGPTSHAAIVAREYGIPAVMGTGDGTSVLTDGLEVRVDGDAGLVTKSA